MLLAFSAQAAVNISTTRVIFNYGEPQRTVMLVNDGAYPVVVQSWVDDGDPQKGPSQSTAPFVVLPPAAASAAAGSPAAGGSARHRAEFQCGIHARFAVRRPG